jgi:hypothetical protein
VNRITFVYDIHACLQYVFRTSDGDRTPHRGLGDHHRCFLALMVDTPGFFVNTQQGGPSSIFSSIDGGRSRIFSSITSQGGAVNVSSVDGSYSWIFSSITSQGAHRRRFLAFMVDALGSPAPIPPRAHRRYFLALMVDAPGSPALAPYRGAVVNVF